MSRSVPNFELQRMLDEYGMERGEIGRTGIFIDLPMKYLMNLLTMRHVEVLRVLT